MKVEYSKRAVSDLHRVSNESRAFGQKVAAAVELRIRETVARIGKHPESAVRVVQRQDIRVVPLARYPYKIFYRILENRIRILHIRHSSREPWVGER